MKNTLAALFIAVLSSVPASAEIVQLSCQVTTFYADGPSTRVESNQLQFDTSSRSVQFAAWPWVRADVWNDEFVLWTAVDTTDITAASFLFNVQTGYLQAGAVSPTANSVAGIRMEIGEQNPGGGHRRCFRTF